MTHYERLGVRPSATASEIRAAYRAAARAAHPDRHGDTSAERMAGINEAYRVLGDPARRRVYDEALRRADAPPASSTRPAGATRQPVAVPEVYEPARFPWRFMLAMASVGFAIVLAGVILYEAPPPTQVDNILRPGDCVLLSETIEASETSCAGIHDAVVRVLVPFDASCPVGTDAYRDRQGMGNACVVKVPTG